MKTYFNEFTYKTDLLDKYQYCTTQPYLSGNYQVDLLLRNHNWAGGVNKPTTLTYKMVAHENEIDASKADFWHNEGKQIAQALFYLKEKLALHSNSEDKKKYLPDCIEASNNRDAYQLYETNFASSIDQKEYILSIFLENIKRIIIAHPENEELQKFNWLKSVESIYELDIDRLELPREVFEKSALLSDVQKTKLDLMFKYTFNLISEVANLTFTKVEEDEDISLFMSSDKPTEGKDTFSALESFSYLSGKTDHLVLESGEAPSDNEELFSNMKFGETLHGIGHGFIDHSHDASIAVRENLLPADNTEWFTTINNGSTISNEYRADNACMSIMAFTGCFYQGKAFDDFLTYMPIDIQAMQHIYGKNEQTRVGDTTYLLTANQTYIDDIQSPMFPINLFKNNVIYTLYDAGGINSFDLSQVLQAKIDLNQGAGHFNAIGNNYFLIAYGVNIHNVIVNSGDIDIKLNELDNSITIPSNGAHVTIEGFAANDKLILSDISDQDLALSGCVHPYSNIGDNETEICFM